MGSRILRSLCNSASRTKPSMDEHRTYPGNAGVSIKSNISPERAEHLRLLQSYHPPSGEASANPHFRDIPLYAQCIDLIRRFDSDPRLQLRTAGAATVSKEEESKRTPKRHQKRRSANF